jgi:uncharacterized protein DUF5666
MKRLRSVGSVLGAAALVMAAGACGSGAGGPLDASPSGATIQGTVMASGPAAGLAVGVMGTALSTTTDAGGRFILAGVPEGSATLQFRGSGVDAQLAVSGLSTGQVLSITVQVSGTQAVLAPAPAATPSPLPTPSPRPSPTPSPSPGNEDNVELRGAVQSVSAPNFTVNGRLIRTNGGTRFLDRNNNATGFGALRAGQPVEVEGNAQADGSVLAFKVKLEDEAGDDNPGDDNGGHGGDDDGGDDNGGHGGDDNGGDDHGGGGGGGL